MPNLSEEFCREVNGNNMPRVEELIGNSDVDINFKFRGSSFPLYIAAMKGFTDIARLLLAQEGIDSDAQTKSSTQTALHIAASRGHYEICKLLLPVTNCSIKTERSNKTAYDEAKAAFTAARDPVKAANYKRIMGLLLTDTLMHVCSAGDLELTKRLVEEEGADVNALGVHGSCALHIACVTYRVAIVDYLISLPQTKVDQPTIKAKYTPLQYAVLLTPTDKKRYHGKVLDHIMQTKIRMAQALIDKGADVNYRSSPDHYILHDAVNGGSPVMVKCLLDNGADLSAKFPVDTERGRVNITIVPYAKLKCPAIARYLEEAIRLGKAPVIADPRSKLMQQFTTVFNRDTETGAGAGVSQTDRHHALQP